MFKNKTLSLFTLLCVLFCSTLTQAQERLWGISGTTLFSVNKDGTDLKSFSAFSDPKYGRYIHGYVALENGEIVLTDEYDGIDSTGTYFFGRVNKISATGVDTLYNLGYYMYNGSWGMVLNDDGNVYIPSSSAGSKLATIFTANPDGSSVVQRNIYTQPLSSDYYLTKTPQGIFGLSRGNTGNHGVLIKVNLSAVRGYDIIYTFTGGADGDRPTGQLYEGNDGYLFGRTTKGGVDNKGIYFKVKSDGTSFTKLFDVATGLMTEKNGAGKFQRFVDLVGNGLIPQRDNEGVMYLSAVDGIYKIAEGGTPLLKVTNLTSERFTFIEPSFQHVVKVNNIGPDDMIYGSGGLAITVSEFHGATGYDIQISTSPNFAFNVETFSASEEALVLVTRLAAGTTYYTRARPNIYPYYGEVVQFTTMPAAVIPNNRLYTFSNAGLPAGSSASGDDVHTFESLIFNDSDNTILSALPLASGERIYIGTGGAYDVGEISKVTPQGIVKLYDIANYPEYAYIAETMVDGLDGYVYALNFSVITTDFAGIIRFKTDGSSYEVYPSSQSALYRYSQIAKASGGIFGVSKGNSTNKGFIYKLRTDLSGVDVVYNFTIDSLGTRPQGELTEGRDGKLYGTARSGGRYNGGVIFKINQDGSGYTVLHHFKPSSGKNPEGKLVLDSDGWFFGTTRYGGSGPNGVVFKIYENGTGFQKLLNISNHGGTLSPVIAVDNDYFYVTSSDNIAFTYSKSGVLVNQTPGFSDVWIPEHSIASNSYVLNPFDGETNVSLEYGDVLIRQLYGVTTYFVEMSETPDFSSSEVFSSDQEYIPVSMVEGTTYYTRVWSSLLRDPGPTVSFTTAAAAMARKSSSVEAYPNPSSNGFALKADPSKVQAITITESSGNVVFKYENRSGQIPARIGEDLHRGVYFLKVKTVDGLETLRIVKH